MYLLARRNLAYIDLPKGVAVTKGLHPCLRDLANTRIREPDSQEMAGSCLAREKIRFSGLVCSRLAFLI